MGVEPLVPAAEHVSFLDLRRMHGALERELLEDIARLIEAGTFTNGPDVRAFEAAFAAYCGARFCVGTASGLDALRLALLAAGIEPGDEVVVPANTFVATVEAVSQAGGRPVLADVSENDLNLDVAAAEEAVTPKTRFLLPVHLYGQMADVQALEALAARHSLGLVEDACQAHGASRDGRKAGACGVAAAFSFYPAKNLGAYGQGGALTTDDDEVVDFARTMRDHGRAGDYVHDAIGFNYRMDGFQGAVLQCKLAHLDRWTARRQEVAAMYRRLLAGARLDLPTDDPQDECVYHQFVVWVDDRDAVRGSLHARGVGTSIHYPIPLHLQKAWAGLGYNEGDFTHAERGCARVLSLPLFPEVSDEQVEYTARTLREVVGSK